MIPFLTVLDPEQEVKATVRLMHLVRLHDTLTPPPGDFICVTHEAEFTSRYAFVLKRCKLVTNS